MRIRPSVEADLDRILACRVTEPVSWATEEKYRQHSAARSYRPQWTWIAEEGERIVARAVWWGLPGGSDPLELDCLHVDPSVGDPIAVGAELVSRVLDAVPPGRPAPSYHLILSNGWRDGAETAAAVGWRVEAARRAGLTETTERLRQEWTADAALPDRSTRLRFERETQDAVWVDLFRRVAEGSLDAATRREMARLGPAGLAQSTLDGHRDAPGRHDWWRVASAGGQPVGFAMPSRYEGGHVVSYLGVVPEFRGRGYVDDLLAEITHILAEQGAARIVADVDATNTPMVASFARTGYRNFAVRLVLSSPT